jgi:hypothetical protein
MTDAGAVAAIEAAQQRLIAAYLAAYRRPRPDTGRSQRDTWYRDLAWRTTPADAARREARAA